MSAEDKGEEWFEEFDQEGTDSGTQRSAKKKEAQPEEEEKEEERLDEYEELANVLKEIRPKDKRIGAIVKLMYHVSLDDLNALRDNLRLAGWPINHVELALKSWGTAEV